MADTNKKLYIFGVDSLNVTYNNISNTCCHVSQDINIGTLQDNEFIELDATYNCDENSSIEFYIIDNSQMPIMPIKDTLILNERIFLNQNTRFTIDDSKPIEIKKNGMVVNADLQSAISDNSALYTISYAPLNAYQYKPQNSTIKIKTVIRMYNKIGTIPYVSSIKIRKYGRGTLWTEVQ